MCDHPHISGIRKRTLRNGAKVFVRQCLVCGSQVENIKKSSVRNEPTEVFDESIGERHTAAVRAAWDAEKEQERSLWQAWYEDYLKSDRWKDKRDRVLKRDGYMCQACLIRAATEVHHLSYRFAGDEPMFHLIAICRVCHTKIHKRDAAGVERAANQNEDHGQ